MLRLYSSEKLKSSEEENEKKGDRMDLERRTFLLKGVSVATSPFFCALSPSASVAKEDLLLTDPSKIVLSLDANNLPEKYTSSTATEEDVTPNLGGRLCDSELQRINVFEKAAPSVVYIDTYVEQRDAFSTNV